MERRASLWLLGGLVWLGAFALITGFLLYVSGDKQEAAGGIDWLFVSVAASAVAAAVVLIVRELRSRPSPAQRAALSALLNAKPGTLGAVVVMKNGVPKVIATVRSREEYLELAGTGRLPSNHHLYLPDDA